MKVFLILVLAIPLLSAQQRSCSRVEAMVEALVCRAAEAEEIGERIQYDNVIYAQFYFRRACRLRRWARLLEQEGTLSP